MKNILLLCCMLFLCACAYSDVYYKIDPIRVNETGGDKAFEDRLFIISCQGSQYTTASEVDLKCRQVASELAYSKGYLYFTVLDQKKDSISEVRSYETTQAITTARTRHSNNYNNYYRNGTYANYNNNESSSSSETVYETVYVPKTVNYTVTNYYKQYTIALIDQAELKTLPNYYKVLDYYDPTAKK